MQFKRDFYLAAATCGLAAGTKHLGEFFFLTVFVYLVLGYFQKGVSPKKLVWCGLGFIGIMLGEKGQNEWVDVSVSPEAETFKGSAAHFTFGFRTSRKIENISLNAL